MQIQLRQVGDVTVLQPSGKMAVGSGGSTLRAAAQDALHGGSAKLLCNLQDVTTVVSSGIGDLVSARTVVENSGARMKLCNVPSGVAHVFAVTQVNTVFDVYDSESDALASFR